MSIKILFILQRKRIITPKDQNDNKSSNTSPIPRCEAPRFGKSRESRRQRNSLKKIGRQDTEALNPEYEDDKELSD